MWWRTLRISSDESRATFPPSFQATHPTCLTVAFRRADPAAGPVRPGIHPYFLAGCRGSGETTVQSRSESLLVLALPPPLGFLSRTRYHPSTEPPAAPNFLRGVGSTHGVPRARPIGSSDRQRLAESGQRQPDSQLSRRSLARPLHGTPNTLRTPRLSYQKEAMPSGARRESAPRGQNSTPAPAGSLESSTWVLLRRERMPKFFPWTTAGNIWSPPTSAGWQ